MEREITVAYNDFSIASMKLWVEKESQRVIYVKEKTMTASDAYGGISPEMKELTMKSGQKKHTEKANMQRRNDVIKQCFSMLLTLDGYPAPQL